jgi:hypothetical protein
MRESFANGGWNGYLNEFIRQGAGYSGTYKASRLAEASVLAELGEKGKAMDALTEGAEKGDFWLFLIKTDPFIKPLRDDPRFQQLLRKFDPP